jgi:chemotaxis protein methyltransferase CheR
MMDYKMLQHINRIIHDSTGIYLPEEKSYLLIHKISRLLKNGGCDLDVFYESIKNGNKEEVDNLINNVTTNHTFFFRERNHLDVLIKNIKARKNKHPKIWCAASSTGEEVYSIIISLLENNIRNFILIASDINSKVLFHMKKGIYNESKMTEMDGKILSKYFTRHDISGNSCYEVRDYLKKYFIVKRINLIDNIKFEMKFDYIFCRNVLMYFNKSTQESVIDMLLNNLDDSGFLFVGHSESLLHLNYKLASVFSSVYNKRQ